MNWIPIFFHQFFEGDPEVACVVLGCQSDSECKETHACRSGECTPVCGPNGLPCGGDAICTGIAHKPICTCPVGLDGDPYVTCSSKSCRADSDCPPDQACINKICQDPCAIEDPCDLTAECKVRNHKPDCSCPAGFTGAKGPGGACEKVEIGKDLSWFKISPIQGDHLKVSWSCTTSKSNLKFLMHKTCFSDALLLPVSLSFSWFSLK